MTQNISKSPQANFDAIRRSDGESDEFWLARDLAPILDYQDWRNFVTVIEKAQLACVQSG